MADQDDYFYLQPGFDVSSLTVPRIRSILVAHNIAYPSSAKKQDLLDILQTEVIPKSKKLLAAQARVKRTSKGITDIPSSSEDLEDDDTHRMPPPPAPKTPRSRKSKQNLDEDDQVVATPRTSRKSRTPSRKSLKERPSESETDTGKPSTVRRKSRKSLGNALPVQQYDNKDEDLDRSYSRRSVTAGESPFSDDNPFQSGSSPVSTSKPTSTSRSRKSLGSGGRNARGITNSPEIKKEDVEYTRSTYEIPVARIGIDRNGVEATEEFTSEANQELQQELASNKQLARVRNSALVRHQRSSTSTAVRTFSMTALTAILAGIGAWYRQEKISIGYCGVGEPNWSLITNPQIPSWVHENIQPQCEPCPPHAVCFPNMEAKCDSDFVLQPHPLNLGGLIPLPPTCEPDSEKERKIKAVADRAVEELRERRANYECGDTITPSEVNTPVDATETASHTKAVQTKLEISEEALKQEVSKMRRKGMTAEDFEDLWRGALGDIIHRDEVEVIRDGSGRVFLSSSSLANLPFTCHIRRSILRAISQHRIPIAALTTALILAGYVRYRIVEYTRAKAQIPRLVSMTLDRLATQAALQADGRVQEAFISVGQLRDDVLRNVFSANERERVWQRVRKIVEGNANVRAGSREGGKTGEWSRVWEWIGPVDFATNLDRRTSGGYTTRSDADDGTGIRAWNEGSPIY